MNKNVGSKTYPRIAIFVVILALLLTACGGGERDDDADLDTPAAEVANFVDTLEDNLDDVDTVDELRGAIRTSLDEVGLSEEEINAYMAEIEDDLSQLEDENVEDVAAAIRDALDGDDDRDDLALALARYEASSGVGNETPTSGDGEEEFSHDDCEARNGYEVDREVDGFCAYVVIVNGESAGDGEEEFNHDDCEARNGYEVDREVDGFCAYVVIVEEDDDDDTGDTSNNACLPGDKVGTWSEGNNRHRIDVNGHGIQQFDFYPHVGTKAISYMVAPGIADPEGVPDLAWGYGSMWEWNPPGCDYDLLTDATNYARARLDSGHSGLVVEWGTWVIRENLTGMSQDEAQSLVDLHRASICDSEDDECIKRNTSSANSVQQDNPAPAAAATCGDAVREGDADDRTVVVPAGHTYVVAAWAPREELMVFAEGMTISGVKGAVWDYACGIDAAIAAEQAQGKNPVRQ